MERLTHKVDGEYYPIQNILGSVRPRIHTKLGKLEDIEEELGIPLEVLFKALKDGVYVRLKKENNIDFIEQLSMDNVMEDPCFYYCNADTITINGFVNPQYTELYFKNYGKTWALTKEELNG